MTGMFRPSIFICTSPALVVMGEPNPCYRTLDKSPVHRRAAVQRQTWAHRQFSVLDSTELEGFLTVERRHSTPETGQEKSPGPQVHVLTTRVWGHPGKWKVYQGGVFLLLFFNFVWVSVQNVVLGFPSCFTFLPVIHALGTHLRVLKSSTRRCVSSSSSTPVAAAGSPSIWVDTLALRLTEHGCTKEEG